MDYKFKSISTILMAGSQTLGGFMKYTYSIETGVTRIKTNTRKYIGGAISSLAIAGFIAVPVLAAKPANPGCFGAGRAAYANENGSLGVISGGVGYYASLRASDNGDMNRDYKTACGGDAVN
jgi:hypothetical protein